jgi:predicted nucleotidyltransferase component of viral defense system
LDFSTLASKLQIKQIIQQLERAIQKELPDLQIIPLYSGKTGIRYRIKYQPADFKYPITIRLDFTIVEKVEQVTISPLLTEFPITIFPLVSHLSGAEILAEKVCALSTRSKGRDLFDVWYLLEKGVLLNQKLVKIKFSENNARFNKKKLIKKIEIFPQNRLDMDMAQFLPKSQKQIIKTLINLLKQKFIEAIDQ